MNLIAKLNSLAAVLLALSCSPTLRAAEMFRVATYNLENYLESPIGTRPAKSADAKTKIVEVISKAKPDVLAIQEMGDTNALLELRDSLKSAGLDFPHWEHITGSDTNIHVAVLSRFPFTARHPHTNENFLLSGRRFQVSRGFLELEIQPNPAYSFTLISAHLKSRRPVPEADEAELREQEAIKLRELIDARLTANPNLNLVVLGDLNDIKTSPSTKIVVGRGKYALFDTRPAERNGDNAQSSNSRFDPRNVTWTHFFGKEDSYSRIDYILLSVGMKREWLAEETSIPTIPNWGLGSDHRIIIAGFSAAEN